MPEISYSNNNFIGNLTGKDAILKRKEWVEMAKLMGMPGCSYQFFKPDTKKFSIHGEVEGEYSEPESIPLIFMEVPDQETAVTLGWLSENKDDKPYMAQIPYDTPNLEGGCRLWIPFVGDSQVEDETGEPKPFRITRTWISSRYPNCRMVQLAPEVISKLITDKMDTDEEKYKNYSFLKVDQNK